ncbi:MAG: hypothetical protein JW995_02125 [Melioribacteraceae bacterium]|nr:hypothetical protein [Melioribacteraceae bacterium]
MKQLLTAFLIVASITFSAENQYRVERKINGNAYNPGEVNEIVFEVYDASDNLIYSITEKVAYDIPYPSAVVFNDATLAVVNTFSAEIKFYNQEKFTGTYRFFNYNNFEYERSAYCKTDNDKMLVVLSDEYSGRSFVKIINNRLEVLSEFFIGSKHTTGIAINDELNVIAVSNNKSRGEVFDKRTKFMNYSGQQIAVVNSLFHSGELTENGRFIGFDNRNAFEYNLNSKELTKYEVSDGNEVILNAALINGQMTVVTSEIPVLSNGIWKYKDLKKRYIHGNNSATVEKITTDRYFHSVSFDKSTNRLNINYNKTVE